MSRYPGIYLGTRAQEAVSGRGARDAGHPAGPSPFQTTRDALLSLLLSHTGCTLLGPRRSASSLVKGERNVGCGWDERLRAGMRTCQTVQLQCTHESDTARQREKDGGGNKRWVSVSALPREGVGSWAALFWLPSVPVSYLCVRVCLFVFLCLATEHAEPVVTQLRHSGKTHACPALSCLSRLGMAWQHFHTTLRASAWTDATRASNNWSRLHRLKWVSTDWMGSIPDAFSSGLAAAACSYRAWRIGFSLQMVLSSSHFYLGIKWPHTSPTDLTD